MCLLKPIKVRLRLALAQIARTVRTVIQNQRKRRRPK